MASITPKGQLDSFLQVVEYRLDEMVTKGGGKTDKKADKMDLTKLAALSNKIKEQYTTSINAILNALNGNFELLRDMCDVQVAKKDGIAECAATYLFNSKTELEFVKKIQSEADAIINSTGTDGSEILRIQNKAKAIANAVFIKKNYYTMAMDLVRTHGKGFVFGAATTLAGVAMAYAMPAMTAYVSGGKIANMTGNF